MCQNEFSEKSFKCNEMRTSFLLQNLGKQINSFHIQVTLTKIPPKKFHPKKFSQKNPPKKFLPKKSSQKNHPRQLMNQVQSRNSKKQKTEKNAKGRF